MAGALLLLFGAALAEIGTALMLLGAAALIVACVAGLGGRGVKERAAYLRSGMTAVDAMTGRQFEVFLEHFFANKGYRVARIGSRGNSGQTYCSKTPTGLRSSRPGGGTAWWATTRCTKPSLRWLTTG